MNKPPLDQYSSVAFILDAGHKVEQKRLELWVEELAQESDFKGSFNSYVVSIIRKPEKVNSDALKSLDELDDDTWIIPLRVVWLPAEKRANRLLPLLKTKVGGGSLSLPSESKAAQLLKQFPNRVLVANGQGATLASLKKRAESAGYENTFNDSKSSLSLANYIASQAALSLDIAEREVKGGRYKVPRFVVENIKASSLFKQALAAISKETKRPMPELLKETDEIMTEMVAKPQPFWLDISNIVSKKITSLAYEPEIVVNKAELAKVKQMVSSHPTALLWTHKTYVDGMALQKVMYENDMPPAHTFGGLNMAFGPMGYTSRRSGIIFIRRTFQDNPVYKAILRHYIGYLLKKKFPFSWAFEGTRSRIGKLMPPRYGLLKYLLEAAHTTDTKNLHIIPVAINYDVIGDVSDYAREQLGETKSAESMKWFVGYLRGLRKPMGRIYMDFGSPVVLESAPELDDSLALSKVAFQVAVEANRVTPITLVSLASMILLSAAPRALTQDELTAEVKNLVAWARERDIAVSSDFDDDNSEHAISIFEVLVNNKMLTRYDDDAVALFTIGASEQAEASYYRNTTVHHFIAKAFAEVALVAAWKTEAKDGQTPLVLFWEQVAWLKNLFKFEFFYSDTDSFEQEIRDELNRYEPDWEAMLESSSENADTLLRKFTPLIAHATLIQFTESYWIASNVLNKLGVDKAPDKSTFVSSSLKSGRRAFLQQRISSKSSISTQLFTNAFKLMQNLELLSAGHDSSSKADSEPVLAADESVSKDVLLQKQAEFQEDLRLLIHRLERIRARALPN